ncbi:MAG: hypothetical protein ACI35P_02670 [Bacillus sp. (in: firmicutes)]
MLVDDATYHENEENRQSNILAVFFVVSSKGTEVIVYKMLKIFHLNSIVLCLY